MCTKLAKRIPRESLLRLLDCSIYEIQESTSTKFGVSAVFCTKFSEEFGAWVASCSVSLKLTLGILYKLRKGALYGDHIGPSTG